MQSDGTVVPSESSVESGSNCASAHSSQESTMQKECCSGSSTGPSVSNSSQVFPHSLIKYTNTTDHLNHKIYLNLQEQCKSTSSNLYDVRLWIQEKDKESKSKGSLEAILDKGVVQDVDRQSLVRTVISHLRLECGNV